MELAQRCDVVMGRLDPLELAVQEAESLRLKIIVDRDRIKIHGKVKAAVAPHERLIGSRAREAPRRSIDKVEEALVPHRATFRRIDDAVTGGRCVGRSRKRVRKSINSCCHQGWTHLAPHRQDMSIGI